MAITSDQLAARLLKYTQWSSADLLGEREAGWLVDAIQTAVQTWCLLASPDVAKSAFSAYLAGPSALSVGLTRGSTTVAGTLPAGSVGCTLHAGAWRLQVAGTSAVATPWPGDTGTFPAVLYRDAMPLPEGAELLVSDPVAQLADGEVRTLLQIERAEWPRVRGTGSPERCTVERIAGAAYLRIDPMPALPVVVSAEHKAVAPALTLESIHEEGGVDLPFPDAHLETVILPLAAAELSKTQAWAAPELRDQTLRDAATARAILEQRLPRHTQSVRPSIRRGAATMDYSPGTRF